MNIIIDGKSCTCEKGEVLLDVARRNGIYIPTLCHHEGLRGQATCRICIVEVVERGRSKLVASCVYPIEDTCMVYTKNEKVLQQRQITLMLLSKRAPESDIIKTLCKEYGVPEESRLNASESGKCILCGLCVRACSEIGINAIAMINRGVKKEVATPYYEPSADCVGCGACAEVCPTKTIDMVETINNRTIWGKIFTLVHCADCGKVIGTKEQVERAAALSGTEAAVICDDCRMKRAAENLNDIYRDTKVGV